MATYIIVGKDTDPLGPNEIHTGTSIDVTNGDVFIVSESADDDVKFESATGNATNFEVRFESSNSNDFHIDIEKNLDAEVTISNGVDLSEVDIKAEHALSVAMTVGDDVSLGKFEGSENGVDVVTIGDRFSTDRDIELNGGDNFLTIGDDASIRKIETDDGDNTITIGDGAVVDDIKTGKGDDSITIGDGLIADDIKISGGDNTITIGDDAVVDDIKTGKGNDTVTVGDNFTADKLETKDGDDTVIIGANGSIDKLDGGKGNDTLLSGTDFPDAKNFETICFARGTQIESANGKVRIETLQVGDRIRTLDHGLQSIRWIGSTRVPGRGAHAPVRIAAGALGNTRTLWVSQQHRLLLSGWKVELHFGEAAVLVPAKHLVNLAGIQIVEIASVEYFHMLFDRHEIVFSEGIESESFHPGAVGMATLSEETRAEIFSLFPELMSYPNVFGKSARRSLRSYEASLLAA
ncbi:Hint domain-containing protein [Thalassorhabdomicrobium marinisediminis]|uniref:Hint domain-containing protein n=1 Tax=Thalassorhabdomicrobium marinisediminis TaxID=2170577 RepID=UPI0024933205|nr:Hint domain-containing protein [Thalassorhabdomicrobium marinisediminis]